MLSSDCLEVFIFNPAFGFLRMSPLGPLPQGRKDEMVHFRKGAFAGDMSMIVRPTSDYRIELHDQVPSRGLCVRLDQLVDLVQERGDVFAGWLDEDLALVFTDMLAEKIKTFGDMRDVSFLG